MLKGLKRTKALNELNQLIQSKAGLKGLAKTLALKRQNELRADLGMGKRQDKAMPLSIDDAQTLKERRKAVEAWLRENLQGKTITTVDGKKVRFNSKSTSHIAHDAEVKKSLISQAITKIVDVLTNGEFIERQELYKERKDKFIAFHIYRKWVDIDDLQVHLQVKAGELDNGLLEAGDGLIVYSAKNKQFDSMKKGAKSVPHWHNAQLSGEAPSTLKVVTPPVSTSSDSLLINGDYLFAKKHSIFDGISQDKYVFLEILAIRPKTKDKQDAWDNKPLPQGAYQLADKVTVSRRQKDNDELRADLGMGHRADKQDQAANKTRLNIDGSVSKNEIYAQVADWLKQNLQGKTITTVDGKKVTFNRKYGIDHIAHDSRRSILASKAVAFVAEVFESGRFTPLCSTCTKPTTIKAAL